MLFQQHEINEFKANDFIQFEKVDGIFDEGPRSLNISSSPSPVPREVQRSHSVQPSLYPLNAYQSTGLSSGASDSVSELNIGKSSPVTVSHRRCMLLESIYQRDVLQCLKDLNSMTYTESLQWRATLR